MTARARAAAARRAARLAAARRAARLAAAVAAAPIVAAPVAAVAQTTGDVGALRADLLGADSNAAVAAASSLGALPGRADARHALMSALELGLTPARALAVIDALAQHASPEAFDTLRHYAGNRRRDLRVAALDALSRIADPRVPQVLIDALGDTDPGVRARAARLLGERKEKAAEPGLLRVFVRGDESAAEPLGVVAGIETADKLVDLAGQASDRALTLALGTILLRAEFGPDEARERIVKTLGALPGEEPVLVLERYVASLPKDEERPSLTEAKMVIEGRRGGEQQPPAPAPQPAPPAP